MWRGESLGMIEARFDQPQSFFRGSGWGTRLGFVVGNVQVEEPR